MSGAARHLAPTIAVALVAVMPLASANQSAPAINIATIEELYAAVENPANRDARLRLRAGTYLVSRPLRLQPGMELTGENRYEDLDKDGVWDPTAGGAWTIGGDTILDARGMKAASAVTRDCNSGGMSYDALAIAIAITGRNRLSRLTILSPPAGIGVGEANDLPEDTRPGLELVIEDTVVTGGRAVTMSNRGCGMRQFRSSFTFERNIVTGARVGLTIANFLTDQRSSIEGPGIVANVRYNRFTGNETGVAVHGGTQGTDGGYVSVVSLENRFERNSVSGLTVRAGVSPAFAEQPSSNRNSVRFSSSGDVFVGNGTPAVTLVASDRVANGGVSGGENHDNRLEAEFVNVKIEGAAPGLLAIGGKSWGPEATPGTGNVVTLRVRAGGNPLPSIQIEDNRPPREGVTPPNRVELTKD